MAINFNQAEFVLSAVKPATFIRDGRPQVTFAGRSNVCLLYTSDAADE